MRFSCVLAALAAASLAFSKRTPYHSLAKRKAVIPIMCALHLALRELDVRLN